MNIRDLFSGSPISNPTLRDVISRDEVLFENRTEAEEVSTP